MRTQKRRFVLLSGIAAAVTLLVLVPGIYSRPDTYSQPLTAEQIMAQSNDRYQGDDFQSRVRLVTTDAQGNSSQLLVDLIAKLVPESKAGGRLRYKVRATVTAPEDAQGLAVLVHEQDFPTPDDIWLFLPAVGAAKRVVPENFRTPLFGSEFTLEELIDREPGLDTHELLREETLDGREVWVVRSTPLDPDAAGFAYRITYVQKETLLQLRMELYDDFETLIKAFSAEAVETIDGIPTRVLSRAENLETGRVSTFEFLDPRYNGGGISDELFDPANLGK